MNATGLPMRTTSGVPTADALISDMASSLTVGARRGAVDLGDERVIHAALRQAGFARRDIHQLAEQTIDQARTALQSVGRAAAGAAEPLSFLVIIAAWVFAYVGNYPA